jgi:ubiquinone/menaquinone biosynthesis C-methylase UbiE
MQIKESFKPKANKPPDTFFNSIRFYLRLVLDLQTASIYRDLKSFLKNTKGNFLDLGCGDSPYRFLLNKKTNIYHGVDIHESLNFDYARTDIVHFDGQKIPFEENFFDNLICTEVLEHVLEYQPLVNEVYRVLKPGGNALFTIPWSARFHYVPNDYFRYTPSALKYIFAEFTEVKITNRGTDITTISSKLIVVYFRNLFTSNSWKYIFFPFWLLFSPLIIILTAIGQISLTWKIGSNLDPLGYTVILKK